MQRSLLLASALIASPALAHEGAHFHSSDIPWLVTLLGFGLVAILIWAWKFNK